MNASLKYLETSVETLDKGKIVVLLYEGAIKNLKRSVIAIENSNFKAKSEAIAKAVAIIDELNVSLDMSQGEVSQNLRGLYNFFVRQLNEASIKCDCAKINDIIKCLKELHSGWVSIAS